MITYPSPLRCHLLLFRYPAQEKVGGDAKIPSIIYYDRQGKVSAVGAEALQERVLESAEDEDWMKVEWYYMCNQSFRGTDSFLGLNFISARKTFPTLT